MSTRCNIRFHIARDSITFYKHYDGYPEVKHEGQVYGVIPMLREFFEWANYSPKGIIDLDQHSTLFVYWMKQNQFESRKDDSLCKTDVSKLWGDFHICLTHELHGDIEYYYEIDFGENLIRIFTCGITNRDGNDAPKVLRTEQIIKEVLQ